MSKRIQELKEKRALIAKQAQEILDKKDQTPEDGQRFDAMMADVDKMAVDIEREERLLKVNKEIELPLNNKIGAGEVDLRSQQNQGENSEIEKRTFEKWLRGGEAVLNTEERNFLSARNSSLPKEARDLGIATGAGGGYLVPQGFYAKLEAALKAYGGMRQESTVISTTEGNDLPMPTFTDTANVGEWLTENTATAATPDPTFGSVTMKSYMSSSKLVPVSIQLLQDSGIDAETTVANALAERIGRLQNTAFTVGSGTGQPKGIVADAVLGKTGTTGQTTSVIYDDLVDLVHSVDPAYRPGAKFMLHDSSVKILRKIKDTTGRPIWQPGVDVAMPDTLLGYQYSINQDIAVMAANAKSILFGNLKKYFIRDVKGVTLLRLAERYAEKFQVGFVAFARVDGRLLDAGGNPVKYYQNSAT